MAITSVSLTQQGTGLSGSGISIENARRSYNAHYRVITDNPTTSAKVVELHFRRTTSLPYYGRTWKWTGSDGAANDRDVDAICNKIEVNHEPKSSGIFNVEVGFEPTSEAAQTKPDSDGNQSDDPEKWLQSINVSYTQISVAIEKAVFEGFDPVGIANNHLPIGLEMAPCSSAIVPFDPPPEEELHIKVIRLGRWVADINDIDPWMGKINDQVFTIDKMLPYRFKQVCPKWTCLVKSIGGTMELVNKQIWYRRESELWINPRDWVPEYLDKGLQRRVKPGDPKLNGAGTWSLTDFNPGDPPSETLVGKNGMPLMFPVLLDGNGQPLQDLTKPVHLKWRNLEQANLALFAW